MKEICRGEHHHEIILSHLSDLPVPIPRDHVLELLLEDPQVQAARLCRENRSIADRERPWTLKLRLLFELQTEEALP